MEIKDFSAALRAMADNADTLADRHDYVQIAGLLKDVNDQAVKIRRDQDLIDELRKQVEVMGRSLDAIGRMRKHVLAMKTPDAVQIFAEALMVIGSQCENLTSALGCRSASSGKTRGAHYGADRWCYPCVARDALERAGALPRKVDDGE